MEIKINPSPTSQTTFIGSAIKIFSLKTILSNHFAKRNTITFSQQENISRPPKGTFHIRPFGPDISQGPTALLESSSDQAIGGDAIDTAAGQTDLIEIMIRSRFHFTQSGIGEVELSLGEDEEMSAVTGKGEEPTMHGSGADALEIPVEGEESDPSGVAMIAKSDIEVTGDIFEGDKLSRQGSQSELISFVIEEEEVLIGDDLELITIVPNDRGDDLIGEGDASDLLILIKVMDAQQRDDMLTLHGDARAAHHGPFRGEYDIGDIAILDSPSVHQLKLRVISGDHSACSGGGASGGDSAIFSDIGGEQEPIIQGKGEELFGLIVDPQTGAAEVISKELSVSGPSLRRAEIIKAAVDPGAVAVIDI